MYSASEKYNNRLKEHKAKFLYWQKTFDDIQLVARKRILAVLLTAYRH